MSDVSKTVIGISMMIMGVFLGLYVGIWLCFIGGIVDVIEQVRAVNLSAMAVAWGLTKIFFAGLFGYGAAAILVIPGFYIYDSGTW